MAGHQRQHTWWFTGLMPTERARGLEAVMMAVLMLVGVIATNALV